MIETPYVETDCVITFEGRTYESGGAVVTDRYLTAYLASDGRTVVTWKGEPIGKARQTGKWRVNSDFGTHVHSYRVTLSNGAEYNARGFGEDMLLEGKRAKV